MRIWSWVIFVFRVFIVHVLSFVIPAEKALTYAFRNCPQDHEHNKKLILVYLIPVKVSLLISFAFYIYIQQLNLLQMFLGHMPRAELLHKYQLDSFIEVSF